MDASGELAVIQRGICAALFKQFLMRALFNDIAVFHEQNTVCVAEMKPRLNLASFLTTIIRQKLSYYIWNTTMQTWNYGSLIS